MLGICNGFQALVKLGLVPYGKILDTDADGRPSMDPDVNPNGSVWAIEGITSPDGRVLGKMGHTERVGRNLYRNVPGEFDMGLFRSAVKYFTGK